MPKKKATVSQKIFLIAGICVLVVAALLIVLKLRTTEPAKSVPKDVSEKAHPHLSEAGYGSSGFRVPHQPIKNCHRFRTVLGEGFFRGDPDKAPFPP